MEKMPRDISVNKIGAPNSNIKIEGASAVGRDGEVYFDNVELVINSGDRIAIIGDRDKANTELMHLIAYGTNSNASITKHPNSRILYVPQRIEDLDDLNSEKTLKDIFFDARGLCDIEERLYFLYEAIATDPDKYSDELGEMLNRYERLGGYGSAESEILQLINGLNININEHDKVDLASNPINASSGQKKKILLARAIFSQPDFLLLDNPSAHLDVEAQSWLAKYLSSADLTVAVTGGSQNFIEEFATKIIKLTDSGMLVYKKTNSLDDFQNYYEALRDSITRQKQKMQSDYNRLAESRDRLAGWAGNSGSVARKAAVTTNRLTKAALELSDIVEIDNIEDVYHVPFTVERKTGNVALKISNVRIGYGDTDIVNLKDEIIIASGSRLRISGRNGSGKSTLIKGLMSILGNYEFDNLVFQGNIALSPQASLGVYFPEQPALRQSETDTIHQSLVNVSQSSTNYGKLLKYWGFDPKHARGQKVSSLVSADEVSRYNMLILMTMRPNVLILDEPTGSLTENYKGRLIRSLESFPGTIIFVSHDVEFNKIIKPSQILTMPEGKIRDIYD